MPEMAKVIIFTRIPQQPFKDYTPVFYTEGCMVGLHGKFVGVEQHESVYMFAVKATVPVTTTLRFMPSIRACQNTKSGSLLLPEKVNGRPIMRNMKLIPGKLNILSFTWGIDGMIDTQTDCLNGQLFRTCAPFVNTSNDKLVICGSDSELGSWNTANGKVMEPIGLGCYMAQTQFAERSDIEYKLTHHTVDYYDYTRQEQLSSKHIKEDIKWELEPYHNKIYNNSNPDGLKVIITQFEKERTMVFDIDTMAKKIGVTKSQNLDFDRRALDYMGTLPRNYKQLHLDTCVSASMGDVRVEQILNLDSKAYAPTQATLGPCEQNSKNTRHLVSMDTLSENCDGKQNGNTILTTPEDQVQNQNADCKAMLDAQIDIPQHNPQTKKNIFVRGWSFMNCSTAKTSASRSSFENNCTDPLHTKREDTQDTQTQLAKPQVKTVGSDSTNIGLQSYRRRGIRPFRSFRKRLNRFLNSK